MNILFLYRIYPNFGGVEVVTTVLANRMVKDGHNVAVVSFEQPHMELLSQLANEIKVYRLQYPVISKRNANKLHEIIVTKEINVIINQWGLPFKTTMLCKRAIYDTNCKLISVLHGSPYTSKVVIKAQDKLKSASNVIAKTIYYSELKLKEQVIKWSIRYNVRNNEKYILLSKAFINPLVKYAHISDYSNVVAIGNPITIDVDLTDFCLKNKKRQILYVGRMDYENKRVNRIVEVWGNMYKDYPEWELVLVGDGPHKWELLQTVKDRKIERVKFEGFQKDPPIRYYKDASVFMLTSDLEGFGLVVVESMSYGVVPIVYGSYEAIYDIIEDGKSGFITPKPYSKENTEQKLRQLISDDNKRMKMAEEAINCSKKFSVDSVIKEWYNLFDSINS